MDEEREERMETKAEVLARTGLSEAAIRREEIAGRFPRRRMLTQGRCGWLASEVTEWIRTRPAGVLGDRTKAANAVRHPAQTR